MSLGNFARVAALLTLAGCISTSDARDEEYAIIRSAGVGYLRVSLDRNEYQSNNEPATGVQHGSLRDADWQRVQELTSADKLAVYVETSEKDRTGCLEDPSAYALSTRTSLGGCWVPDEVTDRDTREMLDFFVPLLASHVPNADGSPQKAGDAGTRDD